MASDIGSFGPKRLICYSPTWELESAMDLPAVTEPSTERLMVTGPIDVPLGRRVVTDKRDYFPFPRQKFAIDREKLRRNGYGDAAIAGLESGSWITYDDIALTGSDLGVTEFPDGTRYATDLEHLGGNKVAVEIVRRLPNAVR